MQTPIKMKEEYLEKSPSSIMPRVVTIEKTLENPLHLFD